MSPVFKGGAEDCCEPGLVHPSQLGAVCFFSKVRIRGRYLLQVRFPVVLLQFTASLPVISFGIYLQGIRLLLGQGAAGSNRRE